MKVNNIGVNAYQQLNEKPQANRAPVKSNEEKTVEKPGKLNIPVQTDKVGSDLGVKLNGNNYLDMLSDEEKQAFQMVFEKFNAGSGGSSEKTGLGRFVDVKL